ncbi:MAG TPA: radical SAM protein [Acidobacteriota bacterium]|nr:radical SAM protein [Acidobacteriota bacterium]
MKVSLINTNRTQPPVAPIGLDYIAEALHARGHAVQLLDLCWEEDPHAAIGRFFRNSGASLIGMTLRNTDDCAFTSGKSFLPEFVELIKTVREYSDAPIVLGGVGFSVMPEQVLDLCGADFGIWGEGEFVLPELAARLEEKVPHLDLPSLIWRENGTWRRNPPSWRLPSELPAMSRKWVDNPRYFRQGGQAGFETKRGCSGRCIYCADPVSKGNCVRLRPPAAVADEIERLLEQGIDVLHTCDGEFNIPEEHALEVCAEIARRGLGNKLAWYAYCAPAPFSLELARAMRAAGCVGIDFGADNGNAAMLRRLGRAFGPADILAAAQRAKEQGMTVMLDLLLGAPGESRASLEETVALVKRADPARAGVSLGVRVYPGTELAAQVASRESKDGLTGGNSLFEPLFFMEPQIAPFVFDWLNTLIGDDRRFLFYDPTRPKQNYNYNANQRLVEAIRKGYRGAFWDILRRYQSE